jgi:septum formation protein
MRTACADLDLASASPRRRELLEQLGLILEVTPANVDETPHPASVRPTTSGASPRPSATRRAARATATDIADRRPPTRSSSWTTRSWASRRRGGRAPDAAARWRDGARRDHRRTDQLRRPALDRAVTTRVSFRSLRPPRSTPTRLGRVAGKGRRLRGPGTRGAFVTELRGSHTNVIGLPLAEVLADLQALEALPGYPPPAFGDRSAVTRAEADRAQPGRVRDRIAAAARAAGRAAESVRCWR